MWRAATAWWRVSFRLAEGNLKADQELIESDAVLGWVDKRGIIVAGTFDFKEAFGCQSLFINFLAEVKRNDGILVAVDD